MPPDPMPNPINSPVNIPQTLAGIGAQVLVRGWLSANNIVFAGHAGGPAGAGVVSTGGASTGVVDAGVADACVVDTGYLSHAAQTVALVANALQGAPLARVVNTHLHSDHCGGNATLARHWPGLQISVPGGSRHRVLPWDEALLSYRDAGQQCEPFTAQHFLHDGDQITLGPRTWQVYAAPGHDPDAVLLFEPTSRTLISGDALWEKRLAIIFPELSDQPGFDAAHQALDLIEWLQPQLVLPGHGQPFTGVAAALDASRQRLRAFANAPIKHRQHAARALVSYHMLEHRARAEADLIAWMLATPVFGRALQCSHDPLLAQALAGETVGRLVADGVLLRQGGQVLLADGMAT